MADVVNELTVFLVVCAPSHEAATMMFESHPHFTIFPCDGVDVMPLLGPDPDAWGRVMTKHRIHSISFASVYPHYVAKAEKKGRPKVEVDKIILWWTGYTQQDLDAELEKQTSFEDFFGQAPRLNPSRDLITGLIWGVRVEDIENPLMKEIRYLDKLIGELAKGKAMEKICRQPSASAGRSKMGGIENR